MDTDWKHSGLGQIIDTDDSWLRETLLNSLRSTRHFAITFMPDTFSDPMTYQHDDVWANMDDDELPLFCACAWRGFGKTSMGIARKVKGVLFRQFRYIMCVGASHDYAAGITENVKAELMANPYIREVFGSIKPKNLDDVDFTFSKKAFFCCDPKTGEPISFIHPKGCGQRVRGANIRIMGRLQRPDYIDIDDLEDDEEVLNEESRKKTRSWFNAALLHCVPRDRPNARTRRWDRSADPLWKPPWRVFYTDTLKHEDANIAHIMGDTAWKHAVYAQAEFRETENGKRKLFSLVPELISNAKCRAEWSDAERRGELDGYCQEKLCQPMSPENACWTRDMFKYYDETTIGSSLKKHGLNNLPHIDRFLIVDPARTANQRSDYTGILAVAADCKDGKIYFRREINQRLKPSQILDTVFDLALELNTRVIAIEATGLEDHLRHQYTSEAQRRRLDVEFVWLKSHALPRGNFGTGREAPKRARASMILPYYEKGHVWHEEGLKNGALEGQELSFPKSTHWDILDCAGYVPQLLELGGRYFEPQVAGTTKSGEGFEDDVDWDRLTEEIHGRNWCIA